MKTRIFSIDCEVETDAEVVYEALAGDIRSALQRRCDYLMTCDIQELMEAISDEGP